MANSIRLFLSLFSTVSFGATGLLSPLRSVNVSEIGVLSKQCLDRRIPDKETLTREVSAWERQRNEEGATIKWLFTVEKARRKMGAAYPSKTLC